MANLNNNQQSNLQNLQARQQVLLTDNAARNAAHNLMLLVKIKLINFIII